MQIKGIMTGLVAAIFLGAALCVRAERQPQMQDALRLLREAKAAPTIETLLKAKAHLEKADHDKGGHRVKAIELIEEAIHAKKDGSHRKAIAKIEQAIHEVEKGEIFDDTHGGQRR